MTAGRQEVGRQQGAVGGLLALTVLLVLVGGLAGLFWWLFATSALTVAPERQVEPVIALEHPLAYLAIPIVVPIEDVKEQVRKAISGQLLGSEIKVPDREVKITVERNGPLVLWVKKAKLHMELPLEFEIEGDFETNGEITLVTDAVFDVAKDWTPALDVKNTYRWDWQPRVGVWPFRFRIGDRLGPYIQKALNTQAEKMQAEARSKFKLREMAQAGWNQLQTPLALGVAGDAWLVLKPEVAWAEPITSDDDDISINFWIGALPVVEYGPRPTAPAALTPLPDLRRGQPPNKTLVLDHALQLPYDEAAATLQSQLQSQPLNLPEGIVQIEQVEMYPAGEQLALRLTLRAQQPQQWPGLRAVAHLLATPVYDPALRQIRLVHAAWAPQAESLLPTRGRWLTQSPLLEQIVAAALWPMPEPVAAAASELNSQLAQVSGKSFELLGGLVHTQPTRAVVAENALALELRSIGEASIIVRP